MAAAWQGCCLHHLDISMICIGRCQWLVNLALDALGLAPSQRPKNVPFPRSYHSLAPAHLARSIQRVKLLVDPNATIHSSIALVYGAQTPRTLTQMLTARSSSMSAPSPVGTPDTSLELHDDVASNRRVSRRARSKPAYLQNNSRTSPVSNGVKRKRGRDVEANSSDDEPSSESSNGQESDPDEEELKEARRKARRNAKKPPMVSRSLRRPIPRQRDRGQQQQMLMKRKTRPFFVRSFAQSRYTVLLTMV